MVWRLPGSRSSIALPAGLVLFLLPLLAAPQQLSADIPSSSSDSHSRNPSNNTPRVRSTDVSALATLALGASVPAVRAPPVQITSRSAVPNSRTTPQLQARSLQDWEAEDFVLLATVDGTIHARDRKTGASRWALEVPSSPMVETVYHRANQSASMTDNTEIQPQDDYLWIVEPSRDGNLFIYHPGPNAGLQRLGFSVRNLVDETPYSGTEPPVTYTARKETTLYTVDARTGAILRVFSSRGTVSAEHTCRTLNEMGALDDDEECDEPSGRTLTLGRIEYTVAVQDTETGNPICTIKYSEWSPNNRDADLQSQYFRTMDDRHIYSMHDGVIFGFDHSKVDGRRYTQRLPSPVARVFDIARPHGPPETHDTPLIMLSQPPSDADFGTVSLEGRDNRVFVNCTAKGGWYAMSELTYPLVTGRARLAECYEKDFLANDQPLMSLNLAQQKAALVGVHSLVDSPQFHGNIPSISGPPADHSNDTPRDLEAKYRQLATSSAIPRYNVVQKGWNNLVDVFATVILLIVGAFIYFNSAAIREIAKQKLDLNHILSVQGQPASVPETPVIPSSRVTVPTDGPGVEVQSLTEQAVDHLQGRPGTPNGADIQSQDSRATTPRPGPRVTIQEPPKSDGDEERNDPEKSPEKRKKARRGRRGGQAHKRGKKNQSENDDQNDQDSGNTANGNNNMLKPLQQKLTRTVSTEMLDSDGILHIGKLKVDTRKILGHGSHGTVVFKGSYDGRGVAVKRMLVEFYDVALTEIDLLRHSDDHHNVVRYFCQEQSSGFLYIALELCPASLQEIVERPQDYPSLITGPLAVPNILRQITAGLRYLHSLKIVHRDIKPQNILVSVSKSQTAAPGALRLLISDFGLCKKLDDNQSSFRATTAHAAGTSGWRAPELLVDDDHQSPPNQSSSSLDNSELAVMDPQTKRRATRAIDIFSLGCIFYYVLTRGGHPYDKDGKFMREANIVKGNHHLGDLQRLGDYAYEADDLIGKMLSQDPRKRPDATSVLIHPFFWSPTDRLSFLCDVSDHFEFEPRDPPSSALLTLESVGATVMSPEMDFLKMLPRDFRDSLGKQRKYTGSRMLDLLRALRNKRNHYNDMSDHLKATIGGLPEGYLSFWTVRFPSLLMSCHWVVLELGLIGTDRFKRYFALPE